MMFKNLKLATQIIGTAVFLTVIIGFLALYAIKAMERIGDRIADVNHVVAPLNKVIANVIGEVLQSKLHSHFEGDTPVAYL